VTRPSWFPIAVVVAAVAGVGFALWAFSIMAG
jgi:hypothetical protein